MPGREVVTAGFHRVRDSFRTPTTRGAGNSQ